MILVDVYIPYLDRTCDFQLEETVPVGKLVMEIAEMISSVTKSDRGVSSGENYLLCDRDRQIILKKDACLLDYNLHNGSRLMLV